MPKRHDALVDRVADSFLKEDLRKVRSSSVLAYLRFGSIEAFAAQSPEDSDDLQHRLRMALNSALLNIRFDDDDRALLAPYLYEQEPRRCSWCGAALPRHGGRGRPRQYCKNACRQRAYRQRSRPERLKNVYRQAFGVLDNDL